MLLDFCDHCMGSKIKSDKVSFDGYEVTNLLSGDFALKNRGFLSDHFIKPPVNVTLQFPCNIAIYRIVVHPVIGRQQSYELKLFTGTKTISKSWLYKNDDSGSMNSDGLLLNNIGYISSLEPCVICFQNYYFRERNMWKADNLIDTCQYTVRSELKARKPGSLCNVSHLNICVTRVKSGGSVSIKRLEVWGMPAFNVEIAIQRHLLDVYWKAVYSETVKGDKKETENKKKNETKTILEDSNYTLENGVQIPEDFIDQITFEVMSVPMLLPCGKNIDQYTLERFVNTEASWGRAPSDPFTGVLFSPGHQVVPNVALKARLDQFLLKHSDKLKVARTLGRSEKLNKPYGTNSSRLIYEAQSFSKMDRDLMLDNQQVKSCSVQADVTKFTDETYECSLSGKSSKTNKRKWSEVCEKETDSEAKGKHTIFMNNLFNSPKVCVKTPSLKTDYMQYNTETKYSRTRERTTLNFTASSHEGKNVSDKVVKVKDPEESTCMSDISDKKDPTKHTSILSDSLDSALSNVLSSLPSFTVNKSVNRDDLVPDKKALICSFCKRNLENGSIVKYRLPCCHYMCRGCAHMNDTNNQCKTCSTKFTSEQITRVF